MDTDADGWEGFERVAQSGRATGNDEDEDFAPGQCQVRDRAMFLVLSTEQGQWLSGKIRSKRNLTEMAPNGGVLEMVVQGVNIQFHDGRNIRFARGVWPAIWLLGNGPWPCSGELDIFEQMMMKNGDQLRGFSTLHFGPSTGRDFVYPNHWGLSLGAYPWSEGDQRLKLQWKRRLDGAWVLTFWVNYKQIWSFVTRREGVLDVGMEAGAGFGAGEPGDPAAIFQRAFDDPQHGLYLICNLSLGGRPFGRDSHANLRMADFAIKRVTVHPG